ncbi:MAG: hypothetical protein AAB606_02250 [Patescibacteria group bacterium]
MGKKHGISNREKVVALIVVTFVVVVAVIGYVKAASGFTGILVAQMPTATPVVTQEKQEKDDSQNQSNYLKDQNNYLKNISRELQDVKKAAKTLNTTQIDGLISQFSSCIQARQAEIGTQAFWENINSTCQDLQRSTEDEMNLNVRLQRDCAQTLQNIQNRKKEKKSNLDRQLKDIQRNAKGSATFDISSVTSAMALIDAELAKSDQLATSACTEDSRDALRDIENNLNDYFRDAYDTMNGLNSVANDARQLQENLKDYEKDKKKRCEKDKVRELKNFEKEVTKAGKKAGVGREDYTAVKSIYDQMCVTALGTMKSALDANDIDAYNDARSTYDELDRQFWDTMNESRQGVNEKVQQVQQVESASRELKRWSKELIKMKNELKRAKKTYASAAKKYANSADRKEALATFAEYVAQAEKLINQIEAGVNTAAQEVPNDPDSWWYERQDELNDLQMQFNEMQQNVQMIGQVLQSLKQADKGLKGTSKELAKIAKETNNDAELMDTLNAILSQGLATYKEAWGVAVSSPEEAMILIQSLQDMGQEWDEAVNEWRNNNEFQGDER